MEIRAFDTPGALAEASAAWMLDVIAKKPNALCCFAAGFTQNETYARLAAMAKERGVPMDRLRVIGLDEWVSLNGQDPGSCRAYMDEHIVGPLGLRQDQLLMFFDGKGDPGAQCARADEILDAEGPIDLLVLGVGMNGHLAFNEPGTSPEARSHAPVLTETSVTVGQKYFAEEHALRQGLTLGLRDLFRARAILAQMVGAHKAPVLRRVLEGEPDPACPASLLRNTHAVLCVDAAARG